MSTYIPVTVPCGVVVNSDGTRTIVIQGTLTDGFTLVYDAASGQFLYSPFLTAGTF